MTFDMADNSIRSYVEKGFNQTVERTYNAQVILNRNVSRRSPASGGGETHQLDIVTYPRTMLVTLNFDKSKLFDDLTLTRQHPRMGEYKSVAPANMFKAILLIASSFFDYADKRQSAGTIIPEFSRILKGLVCGGFVIATGCFAMLEYLVCFLEFMLVTSVGVILFPMSIWEGSKFLSEKFIGAVVGFL